jgi:hypothetical protein
VDEKRFRFDLYVALLALIISAVAAGASAYQTYVIRQQYSATVWPYLSFTTRSSLDKFFELDVANSGIGPALIRSSAVSVDGNPIGAGGGDPTGTPALEAAIAGDERAARAAALRARVRGNLDTTVSSIVRGDVIPAGTNLQLLRVDGKLLARRLIAHVKHIDLRVCYCSLLGNCWTVRLWDPAHEPHAIKSCPLA